MKGKLVIYNDDGEMIKEEDVVVGLSTSEEKIDERYIWIDIPTGKYEDNKMVTIYLHEIFNELLDRLGLRKK